MFILLENKIYNKNEIIRIFPKYSNLTGNKCACILLEKKNKKECDVLIEDIEEREVEKVMKRLYRQLYEG